MKKHLTYQDDTSDKFWKIETDGTSFKVTYGKTGSAGVTQIKEFPSAEKCEIEASKLIAEKLKKGYSEKSQDAKIDAKPKSYKDEWSKIVANNNVQEAFYNHFEVLVETIE